MTSHWIQKKWINQLSASLDRFKWVDTDTANFRCPLCGDSDESEYKARGYFYFHDGEYSFKCHNCSRAHKFNTFLKTVFPEHEKEYRLEVFKDSHGGGGLLTSLPSANKNEDIEPPSYDDMKSRLKKGSTKKPSTSETSSSDSSLYFRHAMPLHKSTLGRQYLLQSRNMTSEILGKYEDDLFFAPDFRSFCHDNFPDIEQCQRNYPSNDQRIIFILRDWNGTMVGFQGRSINPDAKLRYITIKTNDDADKVFGLNRLNTDKPIYVTEGIIDCMFLPNAIAVCGGDLYMAVNSLLHSSGEIRPDRVFILCDNEPRSIDTTRRMGKAIETGANVTFWSLSSKYKDINDMVSAEYSVDEILSEIKQNSFSGLAASAKLKFWKKRQYTHKE